MSISQTRFDWYYGAVEGKVAALEDLAGQIGNEGLTSLVEDFHQWLGLGARIIADEHGLTMPVAQRGGTDKQDPPGADGDPG